MEQVKICQSCSMPIDDPNLQGTEFDGSNNKDYCKYCYKNGAFTNPGLTLEKMLSSIHNRMQDDKLPDDVIKEAVARLPFLKRWRKKLPAKRKQELLPGAQEFPNEKRPLESPPAPENIIITEDDLDRVPAENWEESPYNESPEPEEGT